MSLSPQKTKTGKKRRSGLTRQHRRLRPTRRRLHRPRPLPCGRHLLLPHPASALGGVLALERAALALAVKRKASAWAREHGYRKRKSEEGGRRGRIGKDQNKKEGKEDRRKERNNRIKSNRIARRAGRRSTPSAATVTPSLPTRTNTSLTPPRPCSPHLHIATSTAQGRVGQTRNETVKSQIKIKAKRNATQRNALRTNERNEMNEWNAPLNAQ
jgi:hypothetical protein